MIQVFVWKATEDDLNLLDKLLEAVFSGEECWMVHDLAKEKLGDIGPGLLLAFGIRCFNIVSTETTQQVHQLTTVGKLRPTAVNKDIRQETYEKLQKIAKHKIEPGPLALSDKDLEKLMTDQLVALHQQMKEKGMEVWKGTTVTGRSFALVTDTNTTVTDCDFTLTFEELFAAKYAMEVLQADSLTLVPGDKK